jgi:hypothetical protein
MLRNDVPSLEALREVFYESLVGYAKIESAKNEAIDISFLLVGEIRRIRG